MRKQVGAQDFFLISLPLLQFFAAPRPTDTVSDVIAGRVKRSERVLRKQLGDLAKLAWRVVGQGKEKAGPRDSIYYFDQDGNLNPIR